jgi:hypothetical protein
MLVSRDPLTPQDLDTLESVASRLQFEVVQSPRHSADGLRVDCQRRPARHGDRKSPAQHLRADRRHTFFFHMLRLRDVFNTARWRDQGTSDST